MLSNRELASLIIIGVLVILSIAIPKWRHVVGPPSLAVLKAFATPKIIGVFVAFLIWEAFSVWLGRVVGAWDLELLKDTIIIVFTLSTLLLFRLATANSGAIILRTVLLEALGIAALLAFYLNLAPFPLWAELLLQPVITLLAMTQAVAASKPEWRPARIFVSVLLTLAGLGALVGTTINLVQSWGSLDGIAILRSFLLSIWLPVLLVPFLYAVAFYAGAESLLVRLGWIRNQTRRLPIRIALAVLIGLHASVRLTARFDGQFNSIASAPNFRAALAQMRDYREDLRRRDGEQRDRLARLESNAGASGTDAEGAQLDRREFDGTKRQLQFISMTQMGRYENNGKCYWNDLTELMVDAEKYGLPTEHGVHVETTPDGQRWRGWRRTRSGWVLGMGGSGWRSEWHFSGPDEPTSWPGDSGSPWVDGLTDPDLPPDWAESDGTDDL